MKKWISIIALIFAICLPSAAQKKIDSLLTTRGFAIQAPKKDGLDRFINFIEEELAPAHFNQLILRVDYLSRTPNYETKIP